jgi:predicted GIY-YIG superfamily endonuclease
MEGFIYLIESVKNKKRYLGSTDNPARRINEHNKGKCITTRRDMPWKCLLIINVGLLTDAKKIEYYIKIQKEKFTVENIIKALNRYYI